MGDKKLLLLFLLIFSSLITKAQKPELRFKHITPTQGLSHSYVRNIRQDYIGFIWIATANGLNKYDGYNLTIYQNNPQNKNSILYNDITYLYEDQNRNFWVGTNNGIELYNREFDIFQHFKESEGKYVTCIMEDHNNDLWVACKNALFKYDKKSKKFINQNIDYSGLSMAYIFEDSEKTFWVGTNEALTILDQKNKKLLIQPQFKTKTVTSIIQDKKGNLWFGSRDLGLINYNFRKNIIKYFKNDPNNPSSLISDKVLALYEDTLGRIWIGGENSGLSIFDPTQGLFYQFVNNEADSESLLFNSIYSISADNNQNIYLGTYSGVDIVKKNKFALIRRNVLDPNSLSNNNIICFLEESPGKIWVGTDGGGLDLWDRKKGTFKHYKHDPKNNKSISGNAVTGLMKDHKGRLWVATWGGGLNLFDKDKEEFIRFQNNPDDSTSLISNDLYGVYEDREYNIWVYSVIGPDLINPDLKTFTHYNFPNTPLSDLIGEMLEDELGNLWVGAFRGFSLLDRKTKKVTSFLHNPKDSTSISNDLVVAVDQDSKHNIWISTGGGLNLFDRKTGKFKSYREKDGLPSDGVNGVLEDNRGKLWINTAKGISMFDPQKETFRNFTVSDGLQGNEYKTKANYKLKSGEMLFGGNNGFNIFDPEKIMDNQAIPPVVITSFKIFNEEVPINKHGSILKKHISLTKEVTISYKESVISFEFAALNYNAPEKNQYAYILEGMESKWNFVENQRSATYTNLDPGEYVFRVKGSNNDGKWNEKGASIRIIVTPPFWRTWWFRTLSIFLIIGSTFYAYSARINSMAKQKAQLEEQVKLRTKEIFIQKEEIAAQAAQLQAVNEELTLQKEQISHQRSYIEELYTELKDSIRAAKVIQTSILPSTSFIQEYLPESFILNKPKDVVGGDFYWFNVIDDKIIIACVDCTGHGVSGAFMSITGHHLLNMCVNECKSFIASEILNRLNEEVIKELNQHSEEESTFDGMDISLCIIDKSKNQIQFSGANSPLYLIRDGELIQVKPNKFSIGLSITKEIQSFTNNIIEIKKNDMLYMFSDGYADQLGGETGFEKFMYSRFRELLISISRQEPNKQKIKLEQTFSEWRNKMQQLDDVLVIGFKV